MNQEESKEEDEPGTWAWSLGNHEVPVENNVDTVPDCPHLYGEYYRDIRELSLRVPSRRAEIRSISRKPNES